MTDNKVSLALGILQRSMAHLRPRLDGTPAAGHSERVGRFLAEHGASTHVVVAGILHDVPEDTFTTLAELRQEFSNESIRLIAAVSKDSRKAGRKAQLDKLERVEEAGLEAITLLLVDNADNLSTLQYFKPEKQKSYLRYAKRIQALGQKYLGEHNTFVLHHFGFLRAAQVRAAF